MSIALLNCYRRQQAHGVGGLVRSLCAAIRCRAQQKYVPTTLTAPRRAKHPPKPTFFDERAHAMRKGILSIAAASLLAVGSLAPCGDDSGSDTGSGSNGGGKTPQIGVILA